MAGMCYILLVDMMWHIEYEHLRCLVQEAHVLHSYMKLIACEHFEIYISDQILVNFHLN